MASFSYKAKDPAGRVRSGTMEGSSKSTVKDQLKRMRLRPISVKAIALDGGGTDDGWLGRFVYRDKKGNLQLDLGPGAPSDKDLIVFTKQFATMLQSGVPLVQGLAILAQQQRIRQFGIVLEKVRYAVENGSTMSEALEAYPLIFSTLYVSLVRAGESSGSLDIILLKLVGYLERTSKVKSQVKGAMWYPGIVFFAAVSLVTFLLIKVVPTFTSQFTNSGKPLPEITQLVVDMSNGLVENSLQLTIGAILLPMIFVYIGRTEKGRMALDQLYLQLPAIGTLVRKITVGRFCSTLATMLTAGVPLLDALTISAKASGNKKVEKFIDSVRDGITQGQSFSEPIGQGDLFPPMVVSMISVGEQTGNLDDMLTKVSAFYEDEVDLALKTVLSLIEPVLIVVVGGIVGFIVIAMYLPIFDLAGVTS